MAKKEINKQFIVIRSKTPPYKVHSSQKEAMEEASRLSKKEKAIFIVAEVKDVSLNGAVG